MQYFKLRLNSNNLAMEQVSHSMLGNESDKFRAYVDRNENLKENLLKSLTHIKWKEISSRSSYYICVVHMYTNLPFRAAIENILLSKFKYRDRAGIVEDILDSVSSEPEGKTKTNIMRGANLNFKQANTYLELLTGLGLLITSDPIKSQELARYKLTEKGLELVKSSETFRSILR